MHHETHDPPGWHSRDYLPHCDADGLVQHVVFRLADSLPRAVLQAMQLMSKAERYAAGDALLDAGMGAAALRAPQAARIIEDALLWFDAERYALIAWCIMPNHVHVVIKPEAEHTLGKIVKSWKAYSASRVNAATGRKGALWAPDYFDRFMRSDEHLSTRVAYVENNPVAAGLCARPEDWEFSSAATRLAERKMRV